MQDQTKIKITKGVLIFCAVVVGVISVYTTISIFSSPDLDLQLSPDMLPENSTNETNNTDGVSFDIGQKSSGDFEAGLPEDKSSETYKSGTIPTQPAGEEAQIGPINLLITLEDLEPGKTASLVIIIFLELAIIYLVYRRINKKITKKN